MTSETATARRCHHVLDPLHATVYFSPDLPKELSAIGVDEPDAVYVASRAAAMGAVGPGAVAAAFYNFNPEMIARLVPSVWATASPAAIVGARLRAVDSTLRRLLGAEVIDSPELAEAARLALRATEACAPQARPLYAAHAELPVPAEPHLAYWYATTLLREHRGDGHVSALLTLELDPLEALVSHTATGRGMTPHWVLSTRGWQQSDWDAAQARLRERGVLDAEGALTADGIRLRSDLELLTDRLDRAPYQHLGAAGVERLTELGRELLVKAAGAGAFPADLIGKE
ncbi:hypothetical protein [Streptomyces sp. NPDC020965]|uniref:SCO6745 family protein n=1 Tax=Streptomyces sp. NPDC020965 TaxID=3365105 RepID=UPI0037986CF2